MIIKDINGENNMKEFGEKIGNILLGGEFIELSGDVGSGKTTLTKGIALGMGIKEYVQSPSFTINRTYNGRNDLILSHYDFYRLENAGIMANELAESADDPKTVTIIEWGGIVNGALPSDRLSIGITATSDDSRKLVLSSGGEVSEKLLEKLTA